MKTHIILPDLSDDQMEVVNGSLLGDGYLHHIRQSPLANWKFGKSQSRFAHTGGDKIEFMEWHAQKMGIYHAKTTLKSFSKTFAGYAEKTYQQYSLTTHCQPFWTELGKKWYLHDSDGNLVYRREGPKREVKIKVVPRDLVLTPMSLCVWFMDDGSNYSKDANATISTHGFEVDDVDFLVERLWTDLGIKSKRRLNKKNQPLIYIGTKGYRRLMELIDPLMIWDCFRYKVDRSQYNKIDHRGENHSMSTITETTAREIFVLRDQGMQHKEIGIELGISQPNVTMILNGKRWGHLGLSTTTRTIKRLSKEEKEQIRNLVKSGVSQKELANQFNVNQSTIFRNSA